MARPRRTGGISHDGASAEEIFRRITGAVRPERARDGDAVLEGSNVEVKKASSSTINQIRAVKYIPLVVLHESTDTWYVVPAHTVVALVSLKSRGQHTENPFESATLGIGALTEYRITSPEDLREATLKAIAEADRYPEMRAAMERVLADSRALANRSIDEVRSLISRLNLSSAGRPQS